LGTIQSAKRTPHPTVTLPPPATEAASIAAILPNPRKFKATNSSSYTERRKNWILKQMNYYGPLKFE